MLTCDLEPFRYQATPQIGGGLETGSSQDGGAGASANQINEQALEDYLTRLIEAVCTDLQVIETRLNAIEARLTALENP